MNNEPSLIATDADRRIEQIVAREITVNGQPLDKDMLRMELQNHPAESFEEAVYSTARSLVLRELLIQRARELGMVRHGEEVAANDVDDLVSELINREIPDQQATEEECRRYYEANPDRFCTPPLMAVRHILLAAVPDAIAEREVARENAHSVLDKLKTHPEKFAPLASQFSACPSREQGGSLGQISKGQTVAEFERQLFKLPTGLAELPIATRYGYHVVWVDEKIEGQQMPFDAARQKIANYLSERNHRRALSNYLQRLAREVEIVGIELGDIDENLM